MQRDLLQRRIHTKVDRPRIDGCLIAVDDVRCDAYVRVGSSGMVDLERVVGRYCHVVGKANPVITWRWKPVSYTAHRFSHCKRRRCRLQSYFCHAVYTFHKNDVKSTANFLSVKCLVFLWLTLRAKKIKTYTQENYRQNLSSLKTSPKCTPQCGLPSNAGSSEHMCQRPKPNRRVVTYFTAVPSERLASTR